MEGKVEEEAEIRSRGCLWKEEDERARMFWYSISGTSDGSLW
jgi:hypothetical protein